MSGSSKCAICGGAEADHANSQHVFTTNPGELMTREQREKENPTKLPLGRSNSDPLGRLLEVLVVKGLVEVPEVMYIANLGERPSSLDKGASDGNGS